jgi:hypothetical protein
MHVRTRAEPPPPLRAPGLRVDAMAVEEKSRIGLVGLAVMGQVRGGTARDARIPLGYFTARLLAALMHCTRERSSGAVHPPPGYTLHPLTP